MIATHYPLDRTASHLILQLNDLHINEHLADLNDTSSFEQLVPELGQLAHDAKAQGKYFGIDQLEIFAITGYALSSDGELMEEQCGFICHADALVYARLMFAFLGDRRIAFRAFESDQVLFHAARESYLWNYVFPH